MPRFEYETRLTCLPQSLFDFLLRPQNVARVSDPNTGLNIVAAPEVVEVGSRIHFQLMGLGQVQKAIHEIIEIDRPARILEVQVEGPVRQWRHEHLFEADEEGVRMLDLIDFEPPGGLLGFIATPARIMSSLEDGFFYRQQQLERLVRTGELR